MVRLWAPAAGCASLPDAIGPESGEGRFATPQFDHVDDYHGTKVADPYRWLEDQESPATRAWIDAAKPDAAKPDAAKPDAGRAPEEQRAQDVGDADGEQEGGEAGDGFGLGVGVERGLHERLGRFRVDVERALQGAQRDGDVGG